MFVGALAKSTYTILLGHILSITLFFASIFWTLDGTLIRFSHNGRVCAGYYLPELDPPETDTSLYLVKSGKFMKSYLVLSWILTVIFLVLFFFGCTICLVIFLQVGQ